MAFGVHLCFLLILSPSKYSEGQRIYKNQALKEFGYLDKGVDMIVLFRKRLRVPVKIKVL